ncbi:hypothetical protein [Luteibacter sp. 9135]|uniref:hypothetical protein n=1 Tax=Luteibacter sp. 9135 TaxID=1500893 RepID=UPI00056096E8|nr:hypothetical protein [Luteibacter sp. 9135]
MKRIRFRTGHRGIAASRHRGIALSISQLPPQGLLALPVPFVCCLFRTQAGVDELLQLTRLLACSVNFRMRAVLNTSKMLRLKASFFGKVDFPCLQLLKVAREFVLKPASSCLGRVK